MTQYSNIGADKQVSNILALEKALSQKIGLSVASKYSEEEVVSHSISIPKNKIIQGTSLSVVSQDQIEKYTENLVNFDSLSFNIFQFEKELNNRMKVLPVMTMNAISEMGLNSKNAIMIDQKKLSYFLNKIVDGYN